MKPSLDGAYARVDRAAKHLADLKEEIELLWRLRPDLPDGIPAGLTGTFVHISESLPPIISILIGEIVYNLRAALDYLIYELAILDSEEPQEYTQFPIEDTQESWLKHHNRHLKGLSCKHQMAIDLLQPYRGCNWTRVLRDVSNLDKHRKLNVVYPGVKVPSVHSKLHLQIFFQDDRKTVIETIKMLHSQVSKVLDSFRTEFQS